MMGVLRRATTVVMWGGVVSLWTLAGALPVAAQRAGSSANAVQASVVGTPLLLAPKGAADGRDPIGITAPDGLEALRAETAPRIDGRLDEEAWSRADFARGFVQQAPDEGRPATEQTEVRVLLHGDALYVGARLHDRDGDEIVARLARRDASVVSDWFYVYIDSYHDRRTAFGFAVSAAGVQRDLRVADDSREDVGWRAVWDSRVSRGPGGWTAELRIPLSQLRFNSTDDETRWGINFRRDIARKDERAYWAPIPQGTDRFVSLFAELSGLGALEPSRRIEVLPHTVARVTREPGSLEDPFHRPTETFGSVGANVRVGLGPSMTLSATINPDFGQVEADPATVNLTAFEIFQQERRPFFVEGSDIFTLSFPFWPPLFYSRRIGRSPQGFGSPDAVFQDRPTGTTIDGALKLSGKTESGWSVGVLNAVTGTERAPFVDANGAPGSAVVEPRTNYAVARVAKEFRDGSSGIGTIVTSTHRELDGTGLDFLHSSAYSFGTDAFHRFRSGEYIANLGVLGSHVRGSTEALQRTQRAPGHYFQRPDADHVDFDPTRTSLSGLSVTGRVQRVQGRLKWGAFGEATSPGYEINDLGFNPTLDYLAVNTWLRYEQFQPGRIFKNWSLGSMGSMQRGWGGELRELTADLGFFFELNNSWGGGVWAMRHQPAWTPTALRGGPAIRRPGRWMGSFSANSDRRRNVSGSSNLFWTVEDEAGGYNLNASGTLTIRPSERYEIGIGPNFGWGTNSWQYVGRRDVEGTPLYLVGLLDRRTAAINARLDYTFSPTLSLQLHARPFVATGAYQRLREVADPAAKRFDERFRSYGADEATLVDGRYEVDRDADGTADVSIGDPSFDFASLQMNTVLRWEYRPGSTLFLVWTHDRDHFGTQPSAMSGSLDRLMASPATNVFQLKISYWMGT